MPPNAAERRVDAYTQAFSTPGVAAAVITDDHVETAMRGRDGDGRPVTEDTLFRIASMSKSMTATAVMLLVQDGRIALDEPVVDVLPEFTMTDPRHTRITVRQLLSHTSGLSLQSFPEFSLPAPTSTALVIRELADRGLVADPGTRFEYYNMNFALAARIVEVTSGMPLSEFLRLRVFRPLGMTATVSVDGCDDPVPGLTPGYSIVLGVAFAMPEMPGRCGGSGGVVSTLSDMVRWVQFNRGAGGHGLLRQDLLAELHTVQPGAAPYALGWQRQNAGDGHADDLVLHGGTLATFTGAMAFHPHGGAAAVVLTNGVGAPGELVTNLLADAAGSAGVAYEDPLDVVNAVLLAMTIAAGTVLLIAMVRAPRWAKKRRRRAPWSLIPLGLVVIAGMLVPLAPGLLGGTVDWQYWVVDLWLFPLLLVLGGVLVLGGLAALTSRIVALRFQQRRERLSASTPVEP